jgi:hypothetical protein
LYNQKLTPKLEEMMQQDESRTNLCALFFHKLGLPFVSVLEGGFAAAHSWLIREGPSHHLQAKSVLVDYNPDNSLFGQLETLHNASATEKAQRKMANLLESSMVTMTRRAHQLERLAAGAEVDTKQGSAFINPFARMAKREEPLTDKAESKQFESAAAMLSETSSLELTAEGSQPAINDSGTVATQEAPAKPVEEKANPFKGLGAAFNEKIKQAQVSAVTNPKRSPWARFGGGGAAVAPAASDGVAASAQGLRGFDAFRRTTMSRLRKQNSHDEEVSSGSGANTRISNDSKAVDGGKPAATDDLSDT